MRDDHETTTGEIVGTVSELNVYPVKSLGGIAVRSWPVVESGLAFDRRWMVVDSGGGQLTQRELPRLCLIATALGADSLTLSAAGAGRVDVALEAAGEPTRARVWDDVVDAFVAEGEVNGWLSDVLGRSCRLVRFAGAAGVAGRPWQRLAFPDSLPFLLLGQASLDDLNARLRAKGEAALEMNRFRPNLVVAGSAPFAEDRWRRLSIGSNRFQVVKPCARCAITTTDQHTAAVGREPLRTLATYRRRQGKVMFGQKLIHDGPGEISVGDVVSLLEAVPAGEALAF